MTLPRTTAAALLSALVLVGSVACGSDGSNGSDAGTTDPTSAGSSATTDVETTDPPAETDAPAEAPAGGATLTDQPEGGPAATLTLDGTGFDQDSVTVKVGEVVEVTSTDGGPHGVIVGDLDGASVMGGLVEWFQFSKPGTYPVTDEITSATATVVVE